MTFVSALKAKTKFDELLDRVVNGEEIVITKRGKPVARLVPERVRPLADVKRAAEGLESLQREIAQSNKLMNPLPWSDFKSAVAKGRS